MTLYLLTGWFVIYIYPAKLTNIMVQEKLNIRMLATRFVGVYIRYILRDQLFSFFRISLDTFTASHKHLFHLSDSCNTRSLCFYHGMFCKLSSTDSALLKQPSCNNFMKTKYLQFTTRFKFFSALPTELFAVHVYTPASFLAIGVNVS